MHYLNEIVFKAYEDGGCEEVEVYAAKDERMCDVCGKQHGKPYELNKRPVIPFHANCRCTYLPVIDMKKFEESNQNSVLNFGKSDIINENLNFYGGHLRNKLGPALKNNKKEVDEIVNYVTSRGGKVEFLKDNKNMVYNAFWGGKPGIIQVDENISIAALMHEFRHFKDDEKSRYIGLWVIADNDTFWRYEFNGYVEELKMARTVKAKDEIKQI